MKKKDDDPDNDKDSKTDSTPGDQTMPSHWNDGKKKKKGQQ